MPKFTIEAERIHWYTVEIEAPNEEAALDEVRGWISDDFDEYETNAQWTFDLVDHQ